MEILVRWILKYARLVCDLSRYVTRVRYFTVRYFTISSMRYMIVIIEWQTFVLMNGVTNATIHTALKDCV
jgi:hypothetical protein